MDIEHWLHDPRPRRRFLQHAGLTLAGGSAVFLAACGGDSASSATEAGGGNTGGQSEGNPDDTELLNNALQLEQMAVAGYAAAVAALTDPDARELATTFRRQEQEHLDAITAAVKQLKGTPVKPPSDFGFPELGSLQDVVTFALDLENTAISAYIDAIPKFTDPKLRATSAAITANEAEHVALLNTAVGKPPFPSAFVMGKTTEAGTPGGSES